MRRVLVLALAALAAAPAAAQAGDDDRFLVPVGKSASGFGAFEQRAGDGNDVPELLETLGPTSSRERSRGGTTCVLRWKAIGVTATVVQFGAADPPAVSPCRNGMWTFAKLTDRRWHTRRGVRPGSSERAARRAARGCRTLRGERCALRPVTLDTFVAECGGVEIPAVRAVVRKARVAWLEVRWRGCE